MFVKPRALPRLPILGLLLSFLASLSSAAWSQEPEQEVIQKDGREQSAEVRSTGQPIELGIESTDDSSPADPPQPQVALQQFLQGYQAFQKNQWDAARTAFESPELKASLLADYRLYFLGKLHLQMDNQVDARATFEQLLQEHPTTVWQSEAALELARLAFAKEGWKQAIAHASQALKAPLITDTIRKQCTLLKAQAYEQQGKFKRAYQGYQELRSSMPQTAIGQTAKKQVTQLRETHPDDFSLQTAQAHYDEAQLLLKEGDVEAAQTLTEQFQTHFSSSGLRPAGLLLLAAIYTSQGNRDAAIAQWRTLVERYQKTSHAPKALYRWARFFWNQDEDDAALPVFKRLTKEYPRHGLAAEAWYAIGRIFQAKQDYPKAASAYRHLTEQFPRKPLAREARWRQGWMAYSQKDYPQAQVAFQKLAQSAPDTAEGGSALYWQARSAEHQGHSEEAAKLYRRLLRRYPHGYYALWAEKRLGITPSTLPIKMLPSPKKPTLSAVQKAHYQRCTALADLGLHHLAQRELDLVRQSAPRKAAWTKFLIAEYRRLNDHTSAFQLIKKLSVQSSVRQAYVYPQAYWGFVLAQAVEKELDPYIIVSLIRQESLFNPAAVSSANAYGLMQLLPTTAAQLTDVPLNGGGALTDPELNIQLGTTYLRGLLDRYQGSIILALGAYNAGEKAADKWQARSGDLEPDEFIENISYRETRKYVKLVLRNYRTYTRMYGNGETTLDICLP